MKKILLMSIGLFLTHNFYAVYDPQPEHTRAHAGYSAHDALGIENVSPAVVIGSGPAGLAAALYLERGGYQTLLFAGSHAGGQLTESGSVENMLGFNKMPGKTIMATKREHVERSGVTIIPQEIVGIDLSVWPFKLETEEGETIRALALVIATGSSPRRLGIPGEDEYFGNGVSTCAICDALFYKGKQVIVVGGGDSAVESALQLAPHVAQVIILNRTGVMRSAPGVRKHLDEYENIEVQMNKKVVEVCGNGDEVTHIVIEDTVTHEQSTMNIDGVFLAIGHTPNTALVSSSLTLSVEGHIPLVGRSQRTAIPGVFAAGEVVAGFDPYRQAIIAEGDGAKAGLDAVAFLHEIGLNDKIKHALSLYHSTVGEDR